MCIEHVVDERGFFWEALEGDEGRGLEVRDGLVGDDAVSAVGQCSGDNAGNRGDTALVSDRPHRRQGIQGLLGVGAELDGFAGSCTCVAVLPDLDLLVCSPSPGYPRRLSRPPPRLSSFCSSVSPSWRLSSPGRTRAP